MEARYIATEDPSDDQTCEVFGLTFDKGKWVKVSPEVAELLSINQTFEVRQSRTAGKE